MEKSEEEMMWRRVPLHSAEILPWQSYFYRRSVDAEQEVACTKTGEYVGRISNRLLWISAQRLHLCLDSAGLSHPARMIDSPNLRIRGLRSNHPLF